MAQKVNYIGCFLLFQEGVYIAPMRSKAEPHARATKARSNDGTGAIEGQL